MSASATTSFRAPRWQRRRRPTTVGSRSPGGRRARLATLVAVALVAMGLAVVAGQPAAADPFTPVTLTVTKVVEVDDPDPTQGDGDFYAQVQIDGLGLQTGPERSGEDFDPYWNFTGSVDRATFPNTVPVTLTLKDADGFGAEPDDIIDLNPVDNVQQLQFDVNLATGTWTATNLPGAPVNQACFQGDGDTEHFDSDEGGEEGRLCLTFSALSADGDADGDGLLDGWESHGYDADGGGVDVDLPGFGADPNHKDLFVELDAMTGNAPSRASIQAMKTAFAAAPIDAGTNAASRGGVNAKNNPDGQPGINLWVDTGGLTDPTAAEDGGAANSCGDGIDNGGADGFDTGDPDCLIGDNFGGGELLPATAISDLNSSFYNLKKARFAAARRAVFRYAVSAAPGFEDGSTAGNSCFDGLDNGGDGTTDADDDSDCWAWGGGWGEIGGNDFIEYNHDGGTVMHELGHTLNLRHGGNQSDNCKPNYVSVMNYDNQFGIRQNAGGSILDYSPPRTAAGRGAVPLPNLVENNLNETAALDATDANNQYVFTDANGNKVRTALNAGANYNGDTDSTDNPLTTGVNLDTSDTNGNPSDCTNGSTNDTHTGFDDWRVVALQFRQFGDAEDGAVNKVTGPEITMPELLELQVALNTTDLAVTVADSPDPVAAGDQLTYTLTVRNNGPNPADQVTLTDTLPAEVTHVSDDAGCTVNGATLTCAVGPLAAQDTVTVTVTVQVGASVVYDNGGPKTISNSATVTNPAGTDPNPANNSDSESTLVRAVADLEVLDVAPQGPLEVLIGQPANVSVGVPVVNNGPSSPIDARLLIEPSATSGATIGSARTVDVVALTGTTRTVTEGFTLSCTTPGIKTIEVDATISVKNAADTDPDLTNNHEDASFQVDCVVPVAINVRPGGFPNSINLNTDATVAALTTNAGEYGLPFAFDAASIRIASVRWGLRSNLFNVATPTGATEIHGMLHLERSYELDERTRDRDLDGITHFKPADSGLTIQSTEGCLKGRFDSGPNTYTFLGCDSVLIRP